MSVSYYTYAAIRVTLRTSFGSFVQSAQKKTRQNKGEEGPNKSWYHVSPLKPFAVLSCMSLSPEDLRTEEEEEAGTAISEADDGLGSPEDDDDVGASSEEP